MRKCLYIFLIFLLVALAAGTTGCSKKVKAGKPYQLYSYDAGTERFVERGSTLTFGKDFTTFERSYADGEYVVFGSVEHTSTPDSYIVSCSTELADAFYGTTELFVAKDQLYVSGEYLFSATAIELFHAADSKSADIDGYYHMEGSEDLVYLNGGNMYVKNDQGEYNDKVAYYTVNHDILTMTSVDKNGKDAYDGGVLLRKKYLLARITLASGDHPLGTAEADQLGESAFVSGIYAEKSDYSGRTVVVLADMFFSTDFR